MFAVAKTEAHMMRHGAERGARTADQRHSPVRQQPASYHFPGPLTQEDSLSARKRAMTGGKLLSNERASRAGAKFPYSSSLCPLLPSFFSTLSTPRCS